MTSSLILIIAMLGFTIEVISIVALTKDPDLYLSKKSTYYLYSSLRLAGFISILIYAFYNH